MASDGAHTASGGGGDVGDLPLQLTTNYYRLEIYPKSETKKEAQLNLEDPLVMQLSDVKEEPPASWSSDDQMCDYAWRHIIDAFLTATGWNANGLTGQPSRGRARDYALALNAVEKSLLGLTLCTGFRSIVKCHAEGETFLHLDPVYELINDSSVLSIIRKTGRGLALDTSQKMAEERIVGMLLRTQFDKQRTYIIVGIDWAANPASIFEDDKTYVQFYNERWGLQVIDLNQPLIVATSSALAHECTTTNQPAELVRLIPGYCDLIGLTSDKIAEPGASLQRIETKPLDLQVKLGQTNYLRNKIMQNMAPLKSFLEFGFSEHPITCSGRVLPSEAHRCGCNGEMLDPVRTMGKWAVLLPIGFETSKLQDKYDLLACASESLGFTFRSPTVMVKVNENTSEGYQIAVYHLMSLMKMSGTDEYNFILVIIPPKSHQIRLDMTKHLSVNIGVITQFLATTEVENRKTMDAIARKLMSRINIKLGGKPWVVAPSPLERILDGLMVVGIDMGRVITHEDASDSSKSLPINSRIIGAVVASTNAELTQYFSTTFKFQQSGEAGNLVKIEMLKCLEAYRVKNNSALPSKIICYRGSATDGNLIDIKEVELDQVRAFLTPTYKAAGLSPPQFTYIGLNQDTVTRLYISSINPPNGPLKSAPRGTVVDSIITTAPNATNFFLISEAPRYGVTTPVHYNVLYTNSGLNLETLERLTYKFCFMSFDQQGPTLVPTPSHYAQKLVQLQIDLGLGAEEYFHPKLAHSLHFL